MHDLNPCRSSPRYSYTYALIPSCESLRLCFLTLDFHIQSTMYIIHTNHHTYHTACYEQNTQDTTMHDLDPCLSSPRYSYTYALIPSCEAPISKGPIDNPSTCGISTLGHLAPKSWYRTGTNYPWTPSYSAPLRYVPSPGPIHSYLNLKYENKIFNYSL